MSSSSFCSFIPLPALTETGTYVVYKRRGTHITTDEVHDILSPYGALNQCEVLHPQLREMMGYPLAIVVEFAMFDATRDLQSVSDRSTS